MNKCKAWIQYNTMQYNRGHQGICISHFANASPLPTAAIV